MCEQHIAKIKHNITEQEPNRHCAPFRETSIFSEFWGGIVFLRALFANARWGMYPKLLRHVHWTKRSYRNTVCPHALGTDRDCSLKDQKCRVQRIYKQSAFH